MKKTLSLLLALLMALGVLSALSESFASDYAAMNEAAASVLVMTLYDEEDKEIGKASGFMAFDGRHAVTTWLAVSTAARIEIVTDEGQKLGAFKLLGCDSDCNIAILAFDEDTNLKPLALLEEGSARRAAACVSIAGQNGVNAINTGNIATTFSVQGLDLIQFTAPISNGASGGALLDENGLVAGVTMFGLSGEIGYTVVQNMNFALSVKHVIELWDFCKNDEPVELKDWSITDINPDSQSISVSNKITLVNDTGYSFVSIQLRTQWGQNHKKQNRTKQYTWIKNGESVEFELPQEQILDPDLIVNIETTMNLSGHYVQVVKNNIPAGDLLGKTISLTYNPYPASVLVPNALDDGNNELKQRHVKEKSEDTEDFTIPETIERKRELSKNLCVIVNDLDISITNIRLYSDLKSIKYPCGKIYPGEYYMFELPEAFVNNNNKAWWILTVEFDNGRTATIQTPNQDEICGKILRTKPGDGIYNKYVLEAQ